MRAVSSGTGGTGCGRQSDMDDLPTREPSNARAPHKAADFANGVRPYFSRLVNAQGSRRLGPNYRLSKRVYSARAGQPLTAAYLFAPNGYRIAKLVRNAG